MTRSCRLDALAGQKTICDENRCVFWEPGGAVLDGGCVFDRVDLVGRVALVTELHDLRNALEAAQRQYHQRVNESGEE